MIYTVDQFDFCCGQDALKYNKPRGLQEIALLSGPMMPYIYLSTFFFSSICTDFNKIKRGRKTEEG